MCVHFFIESKLSEDMNILYEKLNRKLDSLTQQTRNLIKHKKYTQTESSRIINLTNITFTKEQINILKLGPQYAVSYLTNVEQMKQQFLASRTISMNN
jgi:hypothetical protein